jgi:triphosphoribosyl-dephospho-CoA synthase
VTPPPSLALARPDPAQPCDPGLAAAIGDAAAAALLQELAAWPKPGLVSPVDSGSHRDMDAATLRASIAALRPYFAELAAAGHQDAGMSTLRAIGVRAEAAMLAATGGVNTHRGAIFGLGLMVAAAGATSGAADAQLGRHVARRWGEAILKGPIPQASHGTQALRRYGAGGARLEAASGFPSVYEIGLPALRAGRALAGEAGAAVQACFALIASVVDTNLLHRGGADGARYAVDSATGFLAAGGVGAADWLAQATAIHAGFVARNLSPGGCADLLAMTLFVDALEAGAVGR